MVAVALHAGGAPALDGARHDSDRLARPRVMTQHGFGFGRDELLLGRRLDPRAARASGLGRRRGASGEKRTQAECDPGL